MFDAHGLLHAIYITTANVTDRDGAVLMFREAKENLSEVKNVLTHGGYIGKKLVEQIKIFLGYAWYLCVFAWYNLNLSRQNHRFNLIQVILNIFTLTIE